MVYLPEQHLCYAFCCSDLLYFSTKSVYGNLFKELFFINNTSSSGIPLSGVASAKLQQDFETTKLYREIFFERKTKELIITDNKGVKIFEEEVARQLK